MKRILALTLTAVLGMSLLAGCSSQEAGGSDVPQKVVHNLAADPASIDPALNEAVDGAQVLYNAFEGLTRTDESEQAISGIAETWDISEDGLTYTFHLRDSKWSDGQPLVAGDFEYAWKRALDPKTAAGYAYQLYYILNGQKANAGEASLDEVGVKAIDDKTLEVKLEAPTPYFLLLTALPCYFPVRQDIVEADPEGWALNSETYISNGPFKLAEWTHNDVLRMVKNENYYDAANVKLDEIEYVMIVEGSTAFSAFQSGEIDYTENVPADQIAELQSAGDANFNIFPYIGTYFYCFNMNAELMKDVKIREALSLAIDREAIVTNVTKGGQKPANGFVAEGIATSTGDSFRTLAGDYGVPVKADIEKAKALLAEAGYPDGAGFPELEILYNTNEQHKAIAEAVQEMWKQNLGINVTLRNEEWKVFQENRKNGNYTVARHGWIGDFADPMTFLEMWITGAGVNDAKYANPEYDKLINDSKSASGEERDKILKEAEALLAKDLPVMPIYYYTNPAMMRTNIKNAPKSALGQVYYRNAYVEAVAE